VLSEEAHAAHANEQDPEYIVDHVMHHVQDANYLDIAGFRIDLPHLEIFGLDISITKHVVMLWLSAFIVFAVFTALARRRSIIPAGTFRNFFEVFVVFVRDEMVYKIMGEEMGRRFLPFFLTQFFFILTCNLLGLVPFMATATGNIAVTGALALITLAVTQIGGMMEQGFFTYLRNIVPPGIPVWLYPIMVPVEILGQFTKPFALTVRLFANMTAGHLVILSLFALIFIFRGFGDVVSYAVSPGVVGFVLFISLLEIFVALIQAYIFTFLSIIFIGAALHPEH
jgi:F-type H+-transporting ATPase subunit a